ncbi:hypothetical protein GQ457_17G012820 [Hibiscus cannabinus]
MKRLEDDLIMMLGKMSVNLILVESLTVTSLGFVACGEFHTYTIIMARELYIWGDETHNAGVLGNSFDIDHWLPKRISGSLAGLQIASITCGPWHTTLIMSKEQLLMFRDGTIGFLCHGDRENVTYSCEIKTFSGLSTIVMACGMWHTAAIVGVIVSQSSASVSSGKLIAWKDGDKNSFGHGDVEDQETHTLVKVHSDNVVHDSEHDCYWSVEATTATIVPTIRGQNKQEPIVELDVSLLFANIQNHQLDSKKNCSEVLKQSMQTTIEACHGFHNIQLHSTSVNFAEIFTASYWLSITEVATDELLEWTRLFPTEATWAEYKAIEDNKKALSNETGNDVVAIMEEGSKAFYDATLKFSGSSYVTSNYYFHVVFGIRMMITDKLNDPNSTIKLMAANMREKYHKYWGNVKNLNPLLFISMILDPRHKMDYVIFVIEEVYDEKKSNELSVLVKQTLNELFDHYSLLSGISKDESNVSSQSNLSRVESDELDLFAYSKFKYKRKRAESVFSEGKTELEKYLDDKVEPDVDIFDVLVWWKNESKTYPIISLMARDILTIPVSTVASESAFSIGGRILDPFRSSLTPKIIECLICAQNWLRSSPVPVQKEEEMEDIKSGFEDLRLNETTMTVDD